jgi:hypothetical protein
MRVACILTGFIRNLNNLNGIKNFVSLNKDFDIDLYSNTYDVIGAETKEPSNGRGYIGSQKVDDNFLNGLLSLKGVSIENYETVNKELDIFTEENINLIKKSPSGVWGGFSGKMKSVENEKTLLRVNYAQWRNVYKNYQLLQGEYDLIVKYRYDANGGNFDISKYMEDMTSNSIFLREQPYNPHSFKLDNGKEVVMSFDYITLGTYDAMKTYCEFGKKENFVEVLCDNEMQSTSFYNTRSKDIKLSSESLISYWCFHKNNLIRKGVSEHHLPGTGLVDRNKFPS